MQEALLCEEVVGKRFPLLVVFESREDYFVWRGGSVKAHNPWKDSVGETQETV